MAKTKVLNMSNLRFGSAILFAGYSWHDMKPIGAANGISLKENKEMKELDFDNTGVVTSIPVKHQIALSFEKAELDLEMLAMLRGGVDRLEKFDGVSKQAGFYVAPENTWELGRELKVPFKPGKDLEIKRVVVKDSETEVELDKNTDYELLGTDTIKIINPLLTPDGISLIIHYEYTPNKAVHFSTGGAQNIPKPLFIKIVNTNSKGKDFTIFIPMASVTNGFEFPFGKALSENVIMTKFEIIGDMHSDYLPNEQLIWIVDEQQEEEQATTGKLFKFLKSKETPEQAPEQATEQTA